MEKTIKFIEQKGVSKLIYFYIIKNEDGTYIPINCNHCIVVFTEININQVMCLVFSKLFEEKQEYIAGCANKLYDKECVHVTDGNKYCFISKYFENPKFQLN